MSRLSGKYSLTQSLAALCVLALLVTGAVWWVFSGVSERKVTAYFTAAVGIYPGGDVRMLGVPIGTVDEVTPQGKLVKVTMSVQDDVPVPAEATALAVSPSVVSDRYVQLAPVYRGGPQMEDGAVIPKERTATPVELDQVYRSLNEVTKALGPTGANSDGALSDLLDTSAQNLDGNGKAMAEMLRNFGQANQTLAGSSKDLFATVDNLQKFSSMLAANDDKVREFNTQMEDVSALLASERDDFSAALAELAVALGKVESFVRDNRTLVKSNVDKLNSVAKVLVQQKAALSESLDNAPVALGNLQNAYNGSSGTLDTRALMNELNQPPLVAVCKLLQSQGKPLPVDLVGPCGQLSQAVGGALPQRSVAETLNAAQNGTLPLPLPTSGTPGGGQ